jgi:hypothetical protein
MNRNFFPSAILCILAAVALLGGCARNHGPRIDEMVNGVYLPRTVLASDITGHRNGATTMVWAALTLQDNRQLRVELEVNYNPTPVLGAGHWQVDGSNGGSGDVRADSIKFLGGQGEGPSFGGRLRLMENGDARFRLTLPLQPLRQPSFPPHAGGK